MKGHADVKSIPVGPPRLKTVLFHLVSTAPYVPFKIAKKTGRM